MIKNFLKMKTVTTKNDFIKAYDNGFIYASTSGSKSVVMFETEDEQNEYELNNPAELSLNADDFETSTENLIVEPSKWLAYIGGQHNPQSEAFNVNTNRFESYPDNLSDNDFHFDTEAAAHEKMSQLGVYNYSVEEI